MLALLLLLLLALALLVLPLALLFLTVLLRIVVSGQALLIGHPLAEVVEQAGLLLLEEVDLRVSRKLLVDDLARRVAIPIVQQLLDLGGLDVVVGALAGIGGNLPSRARSCCAS